MKTLSSPARWAVAVLIGQALGLGIAVTAEAGWSGIHRLAKAVAFFDSPMPVDVVVTPIERPADEVCVLRPLGAKIPTADVVSVSGPEFGIEGGSRWYTFADGRQRLLGPCVSRAPLVDEAPEVVAREDRECPHGLPIEGTCIDCRSDLGDNGFDPLACPGCGGMCRTVCR